MAQNRPLTSALTNFFNQLEAGQEVSRRRDLARQKIQADIDAAQLTRQQLVEDREKTQAFASELFRSLPGFQGSALAEEQPQQVEDIVLTETGLEVPTPERRGPGRVPGFTFSESARESAAGLVAMGEATIPEIVNFFTKATDQQKAAQQAAETDNANSMVFLRDQFKKGGRSLMLSGINALLNSGKVGERGGNELIELANLNTDDEITAKLDQLEFISTNRKTLADEAVERRKEERKAARGEAFTLSRGQKRFGPTGEVIAEVEPAPPTRTTIEKQLDAAGVTDPATRSKIILDTLQKPSTQVTIQNLERGFKVPVNFMLRDENNPSLGVKPIPGGPADRPGAENVGDLAMLQIARQAFDGVRGLVFERTEEGEIDRNNLNRTNLFNALVGTPGTDGAELATRMEFGIQGITRVETGAAMPPSEVSNTRKRFEPRPTDSAKIANIKLDMYEAFINGTIDLLNPSDNITSQFKFIPQISDEKFNAEFNRRLNEAGRATSTQQPAGTQTAPVIRFDARGNRL